MSDLSRVDWRYIRRLPSGELQREDIRVREGAPFSRVLLFDPYFGTLRPVTLLERLLAELEVEEFQVDLIVFRGISRQDLNEQSLDPESFIGIIETFATNPELQIALLSPPTPPGALVIDWLTDKPSSSDELLHYLRELEFSAQLTISGAIYRSGDFHFRLPSHAHADTYVRIADALDDYAAIQRLADWFQHFLSPNVVLLGDTWTLLPLLQELAHRARETFDVQNVPIVTFDRYPTIERARKAFGNIPGLFENPANGQVLAFLSVISSGTLLTNWQTLTAEQLSGFSVDIVALVAAERARTDVNTVSNVDGVARYSSDMECKLCLDAKRSTLVTIDEKRYFPKIEVAKELQMVTEKVATSHRAFWEVASRRDAVRVHANDYSTGRPRHLHIDINVAKLLEDPEFRDKVQDSLTQFSHRCDLLCMPQHPTTSALSEMALEVYAKPDILVFPRAGATSGTISSALSKDEVRDAVKNKKNILILDDAIIGGHTVRSIHRLLQDAIHDLPSGFGPDKYAIRAYAVIGRPKNTLRWKGLEASLWQSRGPELRCYEKLLIPDSPCPWCTEEDSLNGILKGHEQIQIRGEAAVLNSNSLDLLRSRYELLTPVASEDPGLASNLFLCGPEGTMGQRPPEYLSRLSLFGDRLTEPVAYAAMATAMHELREQCEDRRRHQNGRSWVWNISSIMDAYHDPLLHTSFVRAAKPQELLFPDFEPLESAFEDVMYRGLSDNLRQSPAVAAEQKYAFLTGKYPRIYSHLLEQYVEPVLREWNTEVVKYLNAVQQALSID